MNNEVLVAFIIKLVGDQVAKASSDFFRAPTVRSLRGPIGPRGEDGKHFVFSEHEEEIRSFAKQCALKFSDLTEEQVRYLKGPKGKDGRDGNNGSDGKDFIYEEHRKHIEDFVSGEIDKLKPELKLSFSDLTSEEIGSIRGPRGADGRDGKSFLFDEHKDEIDSVIREEVLNLKEDLKLKFSDLSWQEINQIKGPRGQRGKPGEGFSFEKHRGFFESLKPRFSDFSEEEKDSLKLKFSDLSDENKSLLKLKFSDLSFEDKYELKGPRGQRGKPGLDGKNGTDGKNGISIRGPIGPAGIIGPRGFTGMSGKDGINAPTVYDIRVDQKDEKTYSLKFYFTDGTMIESNVFDLPQKVVLAQMGVVAVGSSGQSSSSPTYDDVDISYPESNVEVYTFYLDTVVVLIKTLTYSDDSKTGVPEVTIT
jgi:hypothetical protein